ncbi:hypothetical protein CLOSTMETH_01840 [[Clostridium] methylpentosum DSM 5476]|uniref:Uncharacterized protein n=1 Tax=[Clostridium] methylpentosum DSM 5476 TaxID=537013 RepID=C0EDB4_9FIRM|nr:hypothetical protein CLOSTMETH_01840 [[Clostridium] methylpentosum DSM 5476]
MQRFFWISHCKNTDFKIACLKNFRMVIWLKQWVHQHHCEFFHAVILFMSSN